MTDASEPTALYRQYNADGDLLYIGISRSVSRRTMNHLNYAEWRKEIATIRVEHFDSIQEARDAETLAIIAECPMHNKMCWPGTNNDRLADERQKLKEAQENSQRQSIAAERSAP